MCASIESYAYDKAIDAAITTCLDFNKTSEETISYVEKKYPDIDSEKIMLRVNFFLNQKDS